VTGFVVVSKKADRAIATEEVPRIFDSNCVENLAKRVPLPAGTDLDLLASDVRTAASIYTKDAREPNANELHHEIEDFYEAAERRQYERAADLRTRMSSQCVAYLKARLERPGPRAARLKLPSPKDLIDTRPARIMYRGKPGSIFLRSTVSRRDEACEMVERLCRVGANFVRGRNRSSGKRSRPGLRPLLHAPELRRHLPKRQAEREFVVKLAAAWRHATGKLPARTANRRTPGPFVRFVEECLRLVGAQHANAVKLINELDRDRRHANRA
jgi:hypothetical protein